jgi:hypothetical protein
MDELSNDVNHKEMKAELQALRKKLEDLETKQAAFMSSTHPTVRRRFPKSVIIASIPLAALLVAGGLLWGQGAIQALFIDKDGNARFNGTVGINRGPISNQHLVITPTKGNIPFNVTDPASSVNWLSVFADGNVIMNGGNVGIGTTTPTPGKKLDVIGDARVSASLTAGSATVTGSLTAGSIGGDLNLGNSALYFTKTDHDHSGIGNTEGYAAIENSKNYNALMILGRTISTADPKANPPVALTRVVGMWDNVGIRKGNPGAPLDVVGEIRGKPWRSEVFEWNKGQPAKQMTKSDHSVCFLTLVSGYFYGGGEVVQIYDTGGYWYLGGKAEQRDVRAQAICIGAPDNSW